MLTSGSLIRTTCRDFIRSAPRRALHQRPTRSLPSARIELILTLRHGRPQLRLFGAVAGRRQSQQQDNGTIGRGTYEREEDEHANVSHKVEDVSVEHRRVAVKVNDGEVFLDIYEPQIPASDTEAHDENDELGRRITARPQPIVVYLPRLPTPVAHNDGDRRKRMSSFQRQQEEDEVSHDYVDFRDWMTNETPQYTDASSAFTSTNVETAISPQQGRSQASNSQAQQLAQSAQATVVCINYRGIPYPQPIHDALAGYDWVVSNLLPRVPPGVSGEQRKEAMADRERTRGIAVYGELVGGSLATMLGMTECDPGIAPRPARGSYGGTRGYRSRDQDSDEVAEGQAYVKTVVTVDAVVDWAFPEAESSSSSSTSIDPESQLADGAPSLNDLVELRNKLFRTKSHPGTYFDPFASPIHFLRTPSAGQPPAVHERDDNRTSSERGEEAQANDEFEILKQLEEETMQSLRPTISSPDDSSSEARFEGSLLADSEIDTPAPPTSGPTSTTVALTDLDETKRRRIPLRWPPSILPPTIRMPDFHLHVTVPPHDHVSFSADDVITPSVDTTYPLLDQNKDMARLLRRAWVKYCLQRELQAEGRGNEHADLQQQIVNFARSGDRLVDKLVLKDLMDDIDLVEFEYRTDGLDLFGIVGSGRASSKQSKVADSAARKSTRRTARRNSRRIDESAEAGGTGAEEAEATNEEEMGLEILAREIQRRARRRVSVSVVSGLSTGIAGKQAGTWLKDALTGNV